MNEYNKEGAGRPLYIRAPQTPADPAHAIPGTPALPVAVPRPLPGGAALWGAAAVLSYPLAWYYARYVLMGAARSPAYPVFALLFLAAVEAFARVLGRRAGGESVFWAAAWLAQSVALALYGTHAGDLGAYQVLAWHLSAVYWVLCRTGMQAAGKSNAMVAVDGVTGLFVLPWTGFLLRLRALWQALRALGRGRLPRRRRLWEALAGLALAFLLAWYAAGQLGAADAHFGALVQRLLDPLRWRWDFDTTLALVLSLPVGAWLFGLVGGALRRDAPPLTESAFYRALGRAPRLPALTGNLAVGALCGVYALFFGVQCAEFAAALGAPLPLTPPEASAFAVDGFWELCRVLVLDFCALAALHFLSPAPVEAPGRRRVLLGVFCAFGLGFAGLAAAKLAAYIGLCGLTPRRVLSAWCLGLLGLGALLATLRLVRRVPAARIGLLALALSFSVLCCADIEAVCIRDHLARVQAGTMDVDWSLLRQCASGRSELEQEANARALEILRTR